MSGITWQRPPATLADGVDAYAAAIARAAERVAGTVAEAMQTHAQEHAPWTDRSGQARAGLFAAHEIAGAILTIYLSHGPDVVYGEFLERPRGTTRDEATTRIATGPVSVETIAGGKYAIIWPTIERYMDTIYDQIRQELG